MASCQTLPALIELSTSRIGRPSLLPTQTPVTIPSSFLSMLPYLATLFAVAGLVGRVRAPAAA